MKHIANTFISTLLGVMIYSGLIQYSDTGAIHLPALIFDLKPWFIALFMAAGITLWRKLIDSPKSERAE